MSEGKLKKRLWEAQVYFVDAEKILNEILNEAAKEFPDASRNGDFWDCVGEDDDWIFLIGDYKEAVANWRKKWFGDRVEGQVIK